MLIVLPEEPKPRLGGSLAQLALFVVVVNVCACLIPFHAMSRPGAGGDVTAAARHAGEHPALADREDTSAARRLARLLFRQPSER